MKVFVAGATGVIGGPLIRELVADGHDVWALTRSPTRIAALETAGARPVVCDALDADNVVRKVRKAEPDVVVNQLTDLPASLNPRRLTPIYAANDRVRREGTANLLTAARLCGSQRFVTQGAAYWYAPGGREVKTEDDPLFIDAPEPIGRAVRTLRAVEDSVLNEPAMAGVVLRYGQFYGPGTWYAREGDIGRRVRRRMYPIIGDGSAALSFVHVDDAARATVTALTGPPGLFNVVDDEPAAAREWMPLYAEAVGAPTPRRVPAGVAKLLAGRALVTWSTSTRGADSRRARAELGWRPTYASWRTGFFEALG